MNKLILSSAAVCFVFGAIGSGQAHVTFQSRNALPGSTYKAVLQVGHGCEGTATTTLRVRIPAGVIMVKPMPKPGWQISTREGEYAQAYSYRGQPLTKGVTEIMWTGGKLPDGWYDEFVFRAQLPDDTPGTTIYFPVVQECEKGVHRWIEIPEGGKSAKDYREPAPGVKLTKP